MSDSGFTSVPPRPPPTGQSANSPPSEPNARIIGVPSEVRAELQTRRATIRVQGEVVRQNDDGSIRVRTERGDIDVRVRDGQQPPERGARVEIEIQPPRTDGRNPERAPETATVRELPRTDAPQQQRPTATPVEVQVRPQGEQAQPRQPLPVDIRHAQQTPAQPLPPEGSVVRLQPLPPRVAQALPAAEILQQVVSTLTQAATFQAQIISANAVSEIQNVLVTETSPAPAPAVFVQTVLPQVQSAVIETQSPPSIVQNAQAGQIIQIVSEGTPIQTTPIVETFIQNIQPTTPNAARLIQSAIATAPDLTTQTLPAFTPIAEPGQAAPILNPVILKAQPLNVVIESITPPRVTFAAPVVTRDGATIPAPDIPQTQIIKNDAPEKLITQNQKAGSVNGIVTNITNDALPVLSVFFPQIGAQQIYALQFPSDSIALGTQIQITPQITASAQSSLTASVQAQAVPLPILLAPQPWPALDEALQILAQVAPQTAQAMVNMSPSPANPAQFGPAMMFFVAALRGGDLTQWLGNKASDILSAQKGGSALSRLVGEGATLSRVAAEPMPQDWRALNIPLYWGGDMEKIALYYRHEREDSDDETAPLKSTRFVFDLALERMGKVQLDGLFHPGRLDLVVRTEDHFTQATKSEMRRVYAKALRDTQVTGELSFQNQPESWVTIQVDQKNVLGVSA